MGVQRLGLLGGEPLVRRDIGELIDLAKRFDFFLTVNSNLVLYHRQPEVFETVDLVMTSLDGSRKAHQSNRGEKSYDGVIEAIQDLIGRGKQVVAIAVVTEHNLDQVGILLRQAEEIGFEIHFQPQCSDTAIVRGEIPKSLTDQRQREFWADLLKQKKAGRPVASSVHYLIAQSRWRNFRISSYRDPETRCAAGRGFLYVDPQGNAYPCAYTKGKTEPVNLLVEDWSATFQGTPCTRCNVGPMLEFNLLFEKPLSSSLAALRYLARS